MAENDKMGFVCPDWAAQYWQPDDCTVMPCDDGTFAAVDHQLQTTIYVADHAGEVHRFLDQQRNGGGISSIELLMRDFENTL